MLNLRSYLLYRHLRVSSDIYRKLILVRHAVLAVGHIRLFDDVEHRFKTATGNTDGDNGSPIQSPDPQI
jgi:hypothetical protein